MMSNKRVLVDLTLNFDELPFNGNVHITPTFFFVDKNSKIIKTIPELWNIQEVKDLTKGKK